MSLPTRPDVRNVAIIAHVDHGAIALYESLRFRYRSDITLTALARAA